MRGEERERGRRAGIDGVLEDVRCEAVDDDEDQLRLSPLVTGPGYEDPRSFRVALARAGGRATPPPLRVADERCERERRVERGGTRARPCLPSAAAPESPKRPRPRRGDSADRADHGLRPVVAKPTAAAATAATIDAEQRAARCGRERAADRNSEAEREADSVPLPHPGKSLEPRSRSPV
jgi:hypothetical protein